jgi:hypothetical protein
MQQQPPGPHQPQVGSGRRVRDRPAYQLAQQGQGAIQPCKPLLLAAATAARHSAAAIIQRQR